MTFFHSWQNPQIKLTAQEMLDISQEISRDFTPCFASPEPSAKIRFSSRELLDIGQEISRDFAPRLAVDTSVLTLLPVDPGHLYAYWHLAEDVETAKPADNREQLAIRIYSQPEQPETEAETTWFEVAVDIPRTQQQLTLPDNPDKIAYSAAIGKHREDDSFIVLASSNIVHASGGHTASRQHVSSRLSPNASGQGIGKPT